MTLERLEVWWNTQHFCGSKVENHRENSFEGPVLQQALDGTVAIVHFILKVTSTHKNSYLRKMPKSILVCKWRVGGLGLQWLFYLPPRKESKHLGQGQGPFLSHPVCLAAFVAICPCVSISLLPLSLIKPHRAPPVDNDRAIGVVRSLPEQKVTNWQLLKLRELVPINAFILSLGNRLGGTQGIICLLSLTPSHLI